MDAVQTQKHRFQQGYNVRDFFRTSSSRSAPCNGSTSAHHSAFESDEAVMSGCGCCGTSSLLRRSPRMRTLTQPLGASESEAVAAAPATGAAGGGCDTTTGMALVISLGTL
eukprot:RCo033805